MAKDRFGQYQDLRQAAENETREAVLNWAMAEGGDDLSLAQLRSLVNFSVILMNRHTRQVYDMMEVAAKQTDKP